jgi:hypothetical protein
MLASRLPAFRADELSSAIGGQPIGDIHRTGAPNDDDTWRMALSPVVPCSVTAITSTARHAPALTGVTPSPALGPPNAASGRTGSRLARGLEDSNNRFPGWHRGNRLGLKRRTKRNKDTDNFLVTILTG